MRGYVEIYKNGHLVDVSDNMLVDGGGELIADILMANPGLAFIESASSILDASNYTIQAITFGKGAQGYTNHAHSPEISGTAIGDEAITVFQIPGDTGASYRPSALGLHIAKAPQPEHVRLEQDSTQTPIEYLDLGHNVNAIQFSATNGLGASSLNVGCYPKDTGTDYKLITRDGQIPSAGTFTSKYNQDDVMDGSGFITMTVDSAHEGNVELEAFNGDPTDPYEGLIMTAESDFSSTGRIAYRTIVSGGDLGAAALYGGLYTAGLWTLDIKRLLDEGKTPPYSFDSLNNLRRYRLHSKKIFTKDLTRHADAEPADDVYPVGGLFSFEENAGISGNHQTANNIKLIWNIEC